MATGGFVMRADHLGRLVLEGGGDNSRLLWDGEHLTLDVVETGGPDQPVVTFSPTMNGLVGTLLREFRTGFPSTVFLDESPSSVGYTRLGQTESASRWRRMDLPHPGDDAWRIFLGFSETSGSLDRLIVTDELGTRLVAPFPFDVVQVSFGTWEWDVPILPDLDRADAWPFSDIMADTSKWAHLPHAARMRRDPDPLDDRLLPYHLRFEHHAPVFDAALSDGGMARPPSPPVEAALVESAGSCTPSTTGSTPFRWVWRTDPTALDWQGVTAATAGGCPIRVEVHPRTTSVLGAGSTSRVVATLSVVDRAVSPPRVLGSHDIDVRNAGPGKEQTDLAFSTGTAQADPAALEIVLEGSITVTCGSSSESAVQRVSLSGASDRTLPKLRWSGCMPAPPARQ